jgi:hypothetical protein
MRNIFIAAMMTALLPASAYAQADKGRPTDRSDSEKKHDAEIDRAYRESLKRHAGDAPAKPDPWQTIRPAPADVTKPADTSKSTDKTKH